MLVEDATHTDEAMPLEDTDNAVQSTLHESQYSRLRTTDTGKTVSTKHSDKRSEAVHSEL